MPKFYKVVTFGTSSTWYPAYRRSLRLAMRDANAAKGSGTCTNARVYECDTLTLARTADISEVRDGENVVYNA